MPIEIVVPRLGWSMEEGVFGEWLKAPGDAVRAGEMIYILEGEKAAQEIESFEAGKLWLAPDAPKKGETVKVGQLIGYLLAEGETPPAVNRKPPALTPPQAAPASSGTSASPKRSAGPAARRFARENNLDLNQIATPDPTGRIIREDIERTLRATALASPSLARPSTAIASPRARRKAKELGLRWEEAIGAGRNGRIRERDVIALVAESQPQSPREMAPVVKGEYAPVSKIRQIIAQRMHAGANHAAPVTLTTKIDATALVAFRERLKATAGSEPVPSYSDILIKLIAAALPTCPRLNACWHGDRIYLYRAINIAFAVDSNGELVAPAIEDVPSLTLFEIAQQSRKLAEKARAGALSQAELQTGTFTVTNLGAYGIDAFTPVINLPQSAILGIGRIVKEPVVRGDAIVIGQTMTLSLTFDHRVIDGAPAAAWLQRLCTSIEKVSSESSL
jgi:pyruvate dehydrogenase E2 component (dihydrolipoamide acetyltransferase)